MVARRWAMLNALCGYAWGLGYSYSCWQLLPLAIPPPGIPPRALFAMQIASGVGTVLFLLALPTALLCLLIRPRSSQNPSN